MIPQKRGAKLAKRLKTWKVKENTHACLFFYLFAPVAIGAFSRSKSKSVAEAKTVFLVCEVEEKTRVSF